MNLYFCSRDGDGNSSSNVTGNRSASGMSHSMYKFLAFVIFYLFGLWFDS